MKKILLIALLILCGCDRYELKEEAEGKTPEDIEAGTQELLKAKDWPVTFLGDYHIEQIRFITSWREGRLHYRVTLPYVELEMEDWYLHYYLRDEGTLLLLEIFTRMSGYRGVVDEEGEYVWLALDGAVSCSESTYKGIESIELEMANIYYTQPR